MRRTVFLACLVVAAFAQNPGSPGQPVNQVSGPPPAAVVTLLDYDGSGNLIYIGSAMHVGPETSIRRSNNTLTSIGVAANVATVTCASHCGAWVGQRVTASGALVDTDLNGNFLVLTAGTTTYTFATVNVADATYTESTLVVATTDPLTTAKLWAITANKYDGSNRLASTYQANASVALRPGLAWTDRALY